MIITATITTTIMMRFPSEIETMNGVEIVVEEEELFFFFFNPIFPMHSAKIHTFALSFQKTTKCNQYETERCYNGMACRIHYQLYDAGGMHRKIQQAREEKRES